MNDILQLSILESGNVKLSYEIFDLNALATDIITMTANAFEEDRRATKNAGMNAHLSKPLDCKEVL